VTPRTRRILTGIGIAAAVSVAGLVSFGVASAAMRSPLPPPRYPPADPEPGSPVPPLRPPDRPPTAPQPGPLARRLKDLIDGLSNPELTAVRYSMPPHWWDYIIAATSTPSDAAFSVVMHPMSIDIGLWNDDQVDQLQSDLIDAMGYLKAYQLRSILIEGGVIS
jgi:hypothetical protein